MYRYGIQCALTQWPERVPSVFRGTLEEVCAATKKAGYDGVELYFGNPEAYDAKEFVRVADRYGLAYTGICTGPEKLLYNLCLTDDDPAVRQKAVDRLKRHLDFAAVLGCPVVVGTMRGNIPERAALDVYLDRLSEALGQLNSYAEATGGTVLVENILQYISNYLNSAEEVGAYLRRLDLPRVKLHIDTHSMHMEDAKPYDAVRKYGDILGYVHFSDSNRGYPGSGVIDFAAYYHALLDANYTGWIVSECQPFPTAMDCAVLGLENMKNWEQQVRAERLCRKG